MPDKIKREKKHTVVANVGNFELPKNTGSAIWLKIFAGEKLGEIKIGQGSFRWKAKDKSKWTTISWTKFAEWANESL